MRATIAFSAMAFGMFMALLDIQIVASSLQEIGGGLSASQDQISWVQTAYLVAEIVVIPLSGWLTRLCSTRFLFAGSAIGFALASLACGTASNIGSMIAFRALQGALGASMIPIVFTASFHYFPGKRQVLAAAVVGTISFLAPTLGPVLGGFITDTLSWSWLFYINLFPGLIVGALVLLFVDIDKPDPKAITQIDYVGIVLMAVGLGTLEYVLEEGTRWNWFVDPTIRACAWISAISLIALVARSLLAKYPIADFRAFRNRNFFIGCVLSFISGIGIFTTNFVTPAFLDYDRGFSTWQTGLAIFPSGCASLLGMPVYVALARRLDLRWIMMIGFLAFAFAMWSFTFMTSEWGANELLGPQIYRGLPLVFFVAPLVTLGLGSLSADRLKYASGLFNTMRNLGGAVGIAMSSAMLSTQTNVHFNRLASNLTYSRGAVREAALRLTQQFGPGAGVPAETHHRLLLEIWRLTFLQAQTISYADVFRAIMAAFLIAAGLVPFMRKHQA